MSIPVSLCPGPVCEVTQILHISDKAGHKHTQKTLLADTFVLCPQKGLKFIFCVDIQT